MIRNLKAVGLALCAVFAFGALSASASASAANDVFTSPITDTYVTGEQIGGIGVANVFGTKSKPGTVECTSGAYEGTFVEHSVSSIEVTLSHTVCKLGSFTAVVDDERCKFVLAGGTATFTNTSGKPETGDGSVSLNCEDAGQIRITGPLGCVITFKDTHPAGTKVNQNLQGVKYDNEVGTQWDVKATVTVDGITYTSNGPCQSLGFTATDNDGFLTTNVTFRGYNNAGHTEEFNLTVS